MSTTPQTAHDWDRGLETLKAALAPHERWRDPAIAELHAVTVLYTLMALRESDPGAWEALLDLEQCGWRASNGAVMPYHPGEAWHGDDERMYVSKR